MAIERWDVPDATGPIDPLRLDALPQGLLVLDGVTAEDDAALSWVRRAPCVVVGLSPEGEVPSAAVDVALRASEAGSVEELGERVDANPQAARVLVDVLRATEHADVRSALVVESLAYSTLMAGPEHRRWLAEQPPRRPRAHAGGPIHVERDGSELRVTLARPENRNAFSAAMRDALFEALSLAEVDATIEQVAVRGAGPAFSSGGDLREFGSAPDPVVAHHIRTQRSIGSLLHRLGARVRIEVHGACVGAGVELPSLAGRVVADPATTFRLPEVAMGLVPGAGGTVGLPRRIGRQATALVCLLGTELRAEQALALGLVDEIATIPG